MKKGAQQEIAGFVLIVILVVVAALIFMVISLRDRELENDSLEISSLLDALLKQTTECVVREPFPLNIGELIQEAYGGIPSCKNLRIPTRDYLNETIYKTMENVLRIERRFEAYQLEIFPTGEDSSPIARFYKGNCENKEVIGADRTVGEFGVLLRVCLTSEL